MTRKARKVARTQGEERESRLTLLESDMKYVKDQVSNHIPSTLEAHGQTLERIERRIGDMDAVSRFLSVCLKVIVGGATVIWSVKRLWPGQHG